MLLKAGYLTAVEADSLFIATLSPTTAERVLNRLLESSLFLGLNVQAYLIPVAHESEDLELRVRGASTSETLIGKGFVLGVLHSGA